MAKRSVSHRSITPTATADTVNLVDSTYPFALQGANATQLNTIGEIEIGGQAGSSSPTIMILGRDTTVGVTLTADATMNDAPLKGSNGALAAPALTFNKATTKPQRSVTAALLNLSLNAYGGLIRWVAPPGGEIQVVGNTQPLGEMSLSALTGGTPGLLGAHMIYETE